MAFDTSLLYLPTILLLVNGVLWLKPEWWKNFCLIFLVWADPRDASWKDKFSQRADQIAYVHSSDYLWLCRILFLILLAISLPALIR